MNTEQLLRNANKAVRLRRAGIRRCNSLAPEMSIYLRRSAGKARRNTYVPCIFEQVAGSMLAENCRIESLKAGVLKVRVKPGPYMFELRAKTDDIIEALRAHHPLPNIREIKLICSE